MKDDDQGLLFHVSSGWMGVVIQMGEEPIDAIVSAQDSDVGLPFPAIAKQIGREAAVRC